MFITIEQIKKSLGPLRSVHPFFGTSFLAFKSIDLPVGETRKVVFSRIAGDVLEKYYRPVSLYQGYYSPFRTSDDAKRWNSPRYSSTSLQRITKDTFGDALLHPNGSSLWGWRRDYIERLRSHLAFARIPAFDLSIWLFRSVDWPASTTPNEVIARLVTQFNINEQEFEALFLQEAPTPKVNWLNNKPVTERDIISLIGSPPGSAPEEGGALRRIDFRAVGPASSFFYEPSERLNIITGDNSLGKTFLLECIWWALTGEWLDQEASPRRDVDRKTPMISFTLTTVSGGVRHQDSKYDWDHQRWILPAKRETVAGLAIYSRFDGSFALWDPLGPLEFRDKKSIFLDREAIWYGLPLEESKSWICNGILRDWVAWQISGERYKDRWEAFQSSLRVISPSGEPIVSGEPVKLPFNALEVPTISMPYGEVPVIQSSAGVQRAIGLAYLLVWSWFRHLDNSATVRRAPQRRVVLIIDEVEAHLHPRWQRIIVPALMEVMNRLAPEVSPQIHLATHSPMILASAETAFDEVTDSLHHLRLKGHKVLLEQLPFVKRGRADLWLISEVFGLGQARSLPGENAIEEARQLQLSDDPNPEKVREVNSKLLNALAQDDDFWPRWRFFAKKYGVRE